MTERQSKLTETGTAVSETDIAALAATVRAPESLHRRVRAMVAEAEQRAPARRRLGWARPVGRLAATAAAACALAVAALVAGLSGGGSTALTVQRAAALTLSHAMMPAPRESAAHHGQLQMAVEGVAFPYWADRYGWRSAGARLDRIGGRSVATVFYTDSYGRRIGYAIASGRSSRIGGGALRWRAGVPYRVLRQDGANVVAWPRAGRLCVVSGRGVDAATLLRLAGWSRSGAGGASA